MKISKRFTSVILSIMLTIALLPLSAFAEEPVSDAASADITSEEMFAETEGVDNTENAGQAVSDEELPADEAAPEGSDEQAQQDAAVEESQMTDDQESVSEDTAYEDIEDEDDEEEIEGSLESGSGNLLDSEFKEEVDAEKLADEFFYGDEDTASSENNPNVRRMLSVKGDRLSGKNLIFYNKYKAIIKGVTAAKRSSTETSVKVSAYLGKSKFTAKELGVKKIASGGKLTAAATKKIQAMFIPESWDKVSKSLMSDLVGEDYWVDWYTNENWVTWNATYTATSKSITFKSNSTIKFCLPVSQEFAKSAGSNNIYIYKADLAKIKAAYTARTNAKEIVKAFDDAIPTTFSGYSAAEIDFLRLWYYARILAKITDYDYDAYELLQNNQEIYNNSPWNMIYVFDGNDNTKAVCEGYAKAYKYLCDKSKFKSRWIDCQIVSGDAGGGGHMWNIVRMNDGLNYVVDPTWLDKGDDVDENAAWFLRGAPSGTANGYTIEGNRRVYDTRTKAVFASAERKLSTKDKYQIVSDRKIVIKGTTISKLTKGKKAFTVKWKKMTTPLGALYIDGYQIQYGLKKNFKGAKTVTMKGYGKTSRTVKKLKKKKKYYVRVRTFAKIGGRTYYSKWSKAKAVKTK